MQTASDWLYLLGFFFVFMGFMGALYFYVPWPKPAEALGASGASRVIVRSLAEWGLLADSHEGYAPGHARRVADLALALAEAIALPAAERGPLEQAALLHDIGEIDFAPDLLSRPGLLNQAELFKVWDHSARGARLALEITGQSTVAQWVRWHHERWDGLGYPDGLAGDAIPLPARILRLADSADAMLHARPYRPAFVADDAISEINRLAGISYDPELARLFVDYVLPRYLAERESGHTG